MTVTDIFYPRKDKRIRENSECGRRRGGVEKSFGDRGKENNVIKRSGSWAVSDL